MRAIGDRGEASFWGKIVPTYFYHQSAKNQRLCITMPPVLDPSNSKVDGLAFLGLSLTRKSEVGHPDSATHQTAFDLNDVQDRDYQFLFSTNDDGWLVGGGEPGPPDSYKLSARDSGHVEIMRIGTYRKDWGGLPRDELVQALRAGEILIPQIEVVPTAVVSNPDKPPELEIRFDMPIPWRNPDDPLPENWQLRFLHNQLFKRFQFPSRFCPGAFHSTILRKAEFRSEDHRQAYFDKCAKAVSVWRAEGVKALVPESMSEQIEIIVCDKGMLQSQPTKSVICKSGLWLFTDRNNITHQFLPNFLPPYDTSEKKAIIWEFLKEEWDEKTRQWIPVN